MSQSDHPTSSEYFQNFITAYGRAWDNYDLQAILEAYHIPCFIFKGGKVFTNLTDESKHRYFQDLLEDYRRQQVAWAEIPHFELKLLGDNSALISVEWVCKRADGETVFNFWDSYLLIHIDGQWKILGDTVRDPAVY